MSLSAKERDRLQSARRRITDLRRILRNPPTTGAQGTKYRQLLRELDELLSLRIELERKDKTGKQTSAQAEDDHKREFAAEIADIMSEAGQQIGKEYRFESSRVRELIDKGMTDKQLESEIASAFERTSRTRDKYIKDSMNQIGRVLKLSEREVQIQVFKKGTTKIEAVLGAGVRQEVVDRIWGSRSAENTIAWYLDKQDKVNRGALIKKVKQLVSIGHDARKALEPLKAAGMPPAKLSQWADRLYQEARVTIDGVPGARDNFNRLRLQARAYARSLTAGPLGTRGDSLKFIRQLEKAVDETSKSAARSAVARWLGDKQEYNAITAMRTANNETFREEYTEMMLGQPFVYAVRWILSGSHPRRDQCDIAASSDLLGLGAGVFIIGELPERHISCLCRFEPVVDDEFVENDGKQLAFRKPAGYDAALAKMAPSSELTRKIMSAKGRQWSDKALAAELTKERLITKKKVETKRSEDATAANLL